MTARWKIRASGYLFGALIILLFSFSMPATGGAPGGVTVISDQALNQPIQFELVDPNNHQCIYFGAYGSGDKPRIDCQGWHGPDRNDQWC